jgi:hypothetical protein
MEHSFSLRNKGVDVSLEQMRQATRWRR